MALEAEGSSPFTHPNFLRSIACVRRASVAQLDRASDFGSEGWGFKSLRARQLVAIREPPMISASTSIFIPKSRSYTRYG